MQECKWSYRVKNYYLQLTKSGILQLLRDQSGGAVTLFKHQF